MYEKEKLLADGWIRLSEIYTNIWTEGVNRSWRIVLAIWGVLAGLVALIIQGEALSWINGVLCSKKGQIEFYVWGIGIVVIIVFIWFSISTAIGREQNYLLMNDAILETKYYLIKMENKEVTKKIIKKNNEKRKFWVNWGFWITIVINLVLVVVVVLVTLTSIETAYVEVCGFH